MVHRPRLLSDNGSGYISRDLAAWLADRRMRHVRMSVVRPITRRPGQDRALAPDPEEPDPARELFPAGALEAQVGAFLEHYDHRRHRESLGNLTLADIYFGRHKPILQNRIRSSARALSTGACFTAPPLYNMSNQMRQSLSYLKAPSVPKSLTMDAYLVRALLTAGDALVGFRARVKGELRDLPGLGRGAMTASLSAASLGNTAGHDQSMYPRELHLTPCAAPLGAKQIRRLWTF